MKVIVESQPKINLISPSKLSNNEAGIIRQWPGDSKLEGSIVVKTEGGFVLFMNNGYIQYYVLTCDWANIKVEVVAELKVSAK